VARLGERRTLYVGQFFGGLGMAIAGLARTGLGYFISIPVMMIWSISGPAAQGMMTRRVSEREQGELQGAISSLRAIAVIIGPALFTFTFAYFIDAKHGWNVPGAPWYLAALLLFFAMIMSTRIPRVSADAESTSPAPAVSGNMIPPSGIAPDVVPIVEPEENV
jgi:DHA1 family tetracycline resistance protein-like MFS transporter